MFRTVATAGGDLTELFLEIASHTANLFDANRGGGVFIDDGEDIAAYSNGVGGPEILHGLNEDASALTKVLRERIVIRFDDQSVVADPDFANSTAIAVRLGFKSVAYVPVLAGERPIGLAVNRVTVDPFTDVDVELLRALAVQLANAVESVRLVQDLENRNAEVNEALALQTATSEVLRIISAHPGDVRTALEGIIDRARVLGEADVGIICLRDDRILNVMASSGEESEQLVGTLSAVCSSQSGSRLWAGG